MHVPEHTPSPKSDDILVKIGNYISEGIQRFIAFLFFLVFAGAVYGFLVARANPGMQPFLILAPAIAGLLAYYNRAFALAVFGLIILIVVIL